MTADERADVEQMRTAFFTRTRKLVVGLYATTAVIALAVGAAGLAVSPGRAVVGMIVGLVVSVVLFVVSPRIPTTARTARGLIVVGPVAGVLVSMLFLDLDELSTASQAALAGALAGSLVGMIVGIVLLRRRLARDDQLLLRQKRLGFDPEHPWSWLRG